MLNAIPSITSWTSCEEHEQEKRAGRVWAWGYVSTPGRPEVVSSLQTRTAGSSGFLSRHAEPARVRGGKKKKVVKTFWVCLFLHNKRALMTVSAPQARHEELRRLRAIDKQQQARSKIRYMVW